MKKLLILIYLLLISNTAFAISLGDLKKTLENATEEIKKQVEEPKENSDTKIKEEKTIKNNENENSNSLSKYEVPFHPDFNEDQIIRWINNYENLTVKNTKGKIIYTLKNFENQSAAIQKALRNKFPDQVPKDLTASELKAKEEEDKLKAEKLAERFQDLPNYTSDNHKMNWNGFREVANKLEKSKDKIIADGGIAGKNVICTLSDGDQYGFYFLGRSYNKEAMVYRFFPGNPLASTDANGIHEGLMVWSEKYVDDDPKYLYIKGKQIERDTLKYKDGPYKGKCELYDRDLYDYFKAKSDQYTNKLNKEKKEQLDKNKI